MVRSFDPFYGQKELEGEISKCDGTNPCWVRVPSKKSSLPRSTILVLSAIDFPFDLIHSFDSARTNSADCESIYITFIV